MIRPRFFRGWVTFNGKNKTKKFECNLFTGKIIQIWFSAHRISYLTLNNNNNNPLSIKQISVFLPRNWFAVSNLKSRRYIEMWTVNTVIGLVERSSFFREDSNVCLRFSVFFLSVSCSWINLLTFLCFFFYQNISNGIGRTHIMHNTESRGEEVKGVYGFRIENSNFHACCDCMTWHNAVRWLIAIENTQ